MAKTVTVMGVKIAYGTIAKVVLVASAYAYSRAQAKKALRGFSTLSGRTVTVRDPVAARQIIYGQAKVGGVIVFAGASGANNEYLNLVIALAGHEVQEIGDVYFDDEVALTGGGSSAGGRFAGYAEIYKKLGGDSQTVETNLQTEMTSGVWTNNHRLRGIAYLYVRLKHNPDVFANGVPNITALVKGKKVYDPRTTTTAWSANSALCLRDFLTDTRYGLGMAAGEIDDTEVGAAANVCDEAVALAVGGTEARYKTNGVALSSETAAEIVDRLAGAMAGSLFYVGGKWIMRAGAHPTPTLTFTEDDLRGAIEIQTKDSRRETCNRVRGTYVSAANNWQPADFPPVVNATYKSEDGGEDLWRDIVLPFTTSDTAAQRIAKIELERARQDITVVFPAKLTALTCQCGDVVQLTLARYGWSAKQFEVVESSLVIAPDGEIGVDLTLRETAAGVWDWSEEETAVDLAPNTNLPDPYTVPTPTGLTLTSSGMALAQPDGTILNRLKVAWTAPARSFVTNGGLVWIEYKRSADSDWITWGSVRGDQTADYITDVKVGVAYDVRVRFENVWGVRGAYATVSSHTIAANGLTPTNPTAATKTAEGVTTAPDGTTLAYLTFSVPALPANAAKQFLVYKRSSDTDWLVAAGPLTNTSTASVTIPDLTPAVAYAVATLALSSLDVPSSYIPATSSPFTAPTKTGAPATPTGGLLQASGVVPKFYTSTSIHLFGSCVSWTPNADADLAYYEVKATLTNSDAATDYSWTQYDGGSPLMRVTEPRLIIYNLSLDIGHVRIRAVNTSGVASAWAYLGNANSYASIGVGNAAAKSVGTTAGTVAAGDDSRITGAAQKSSNLSDLANAATARGNLGVRDANFTRSLSGGAATESFTYNHAFGAQQYKVIIQCVSDPDYLICGMDYNSGSNDANNTVFKVATLDGSNIVGGSYRFVVHFLP